MEVAGMCLFLGSHLLAWYYHKGLNRKMDPAWLYLWGSLVGYLSALLMWS